MGVRVTVTFVNTIASKASWLDPPLPTLPRSTGGGKAANAALKFRIHVEAFSIALPIASRVRLTASSLGSRPSELSNGSAEAGPS